MQTIAVSVLSLAVLLASSVTTNAASQATHWQYRFTSSKERLALAKPAPSTQKKAKKFHTTTAPAATSTPVKKPAASATAPTQPPATPAPTPTNTAQCTAGWYVTGYFTPVENEYTGETKTVAVQGISHNFNAAFLKDVQTEGWGKTITGTYIGYYDNAWHFSSRPLDAKGNALNVSTIAVDPSHIKLGSKVQITTLKEGFNTKTFTATDIGTGVSGKHIDVYTGEGSAAKALTYKITGNNNTVCVQ